MLKKTSMSLEMFSSALNCCTWWKNFKMQMFAMIKTWTARRILGKIGISKLLERTASDAVIAVSGCAGVSVHPIPTRGEEYAHRITAWRLPTRIWKPNCISGDWNLQKTLLKMKNREESQRNFHYSDGSGQIDQVDRIYDDLVCWSNIRISMEYF